MKHKEELFFSCMESPKRFYLTSIGASVAAVSAAASVASTKASTTTDNNHNHNKINLSCRNGTKKGGGDSSKYVVELSENFKRWEEWELVLNDDHSLAIKSVPFQVYLSSCIEGSNNNNNNNNNNNAYYVDDDNRTETTIDGDISIAGEGRGGTVGCTTAFTNSNSNNHSMSSTNERFWDLEMVSTPDHTGIIVKFYNLANGKILACDQDGPYLVDEEEYIDIMEQKQQQQQDDNNHNDKDHHDGSSTASNSNSNSSISIDTSIFLWRMEFVTGELCFVTNPSTINHQRLKCDPFGNVSLEKHNWKGWEVWRFIDISSNNTGGENENHHHREVLITSWTHSTRILASNWKGHVYTVEDRQHGFGIKWRIIKIKQQQQQQQRNNESKSESGNDNYNGDNDNDGLLIQSIETGRYLHVNPKTFKLMTIDIPQEVQQENVLGGTKWQFEPANRNVFYLRGQKQHQSQQQNMYLSCNRDKGLKVATKPQSWEEWQVEKVDGTESKYTIYSCHFQRYLAVNHLGYLITASTKELENANYYDDNSDINILWDIEIGPSSGGGYILSPENWKNSRLCYDSEKQNWKVTSLKDDADWEWNFLPKMPPTLSGPQLGAMVGVGVGALALTLAGPAIATWGIATLGFGSEGIAAGSFAASMMSAEAIASGTGGVAAGGVVATLQSIGAAGLGVTGTSAAMSGGAIIGSTAGLGITSVVNSAVEKGKHGQNLTTTTATSNNNVDLEDEQHTLVSTTTTTTRRLPLAAWRSW